MEKENKKFLKSILETPSVTGTETKVASLIRDRLSETADEVETNVMGSVHAKLNGKGNAPSVMIAAHMDEVGLMVTYISKEGFLSVAAVGGVDAAILPGMRVDVHTESGTYRGVVGRKPIHLISPDERKNVTPLDSLVIDLGLPAKKVARLVHIGDVITYGVGFETFGKGMAVSRGFDDKMGVYIALRVLEEVKKAGGSQGNYICAATVQEEIGLRGGTTSAYGVHPDVAIALDVTHATDYPGIDPSKYGKLVCGAGPVIARGPNINPVVFNRLLAAAKKAHVPVQIEAEPRVTGTDAAAMQIQRGGKATGLVSVALRYMHTPTEVLALKDLELCVKLLTQFVLDLDEDVSFVPGM
jgi:endoglucanase